MRVLHLPLLNDASFYIVSKCLCFVITGLHLLW